MKRLIFRTERNETDFSVEDEHFISGILRESFDYTKWQSEHFDNANPDEFLETAFVYDDTYPIE